VNIDLSWDIDVRFGDLRKDVMLQKQVSLPIIWATHFCVFLLHIFLCSPLQMPVHLLFVSLPYHFAIFLAISPSQFYHSVFYTTFLSFLVVMSCSLPPT